MEISEPPPLPRKAASDRNGVEEHLAARVFLTAHLDCTKAELVCELARW
jgi:hypothetical protein